LNLAREKRKEPTFSVENVCDLSTKEKVVKSQQTLRLLSKVIYQIEAEMAIDTFRLNILKNN
jgi:hypothetical protein